MAAYWEVAAHSVHNMFYMYKYLIVNLDFPTSVFFLIAPFPDRCLLVPFLVFKDYWLLKACKRTIRPGILTCVSTFILTTDQTEVGTQAIAVKQFF